MSNPAAWSRKYLCYDFADPVLLEQALTHKSFAAVNNERLEFLGDSILGFVIAETLYLQEADVDEGGLTRFRALLVRGATLAELARELGLDTVMLLGGGESRSGGHQRDSILADGLESVLGAVLLDGGYAAAKDVVLRLYAQRLASLPAAEALKDPKSQLQEALQSIGAPIPDYRLEQEFGPPHARHFEVSCSIEARDIKTDGSGSSRRAAEQEAAAKALLLLADE